MLMSHLSAHLIIAQLFLSALSALGGTTVFCLLFAVNVIARSYVYARVPDTAGRTLPEVQAYWENGRHWKSSSLTSTATQAPGSERAWQTGSTQAPMLPNEPAKPTPGRR